MEVTSYSIKLLSNLYECLTDILCCVFFSVLCDFLLCQVVTGIFVKAVPYTHTVTVRNSAAVLNINFIA